MVKSIKTFSLLATFLTAGLVHGVEFQNPRLYERLGVDGSLYTAATMDVRFTTKDRFFKNLDKDKSGEISDAEFDTFMASFPREKARQGIAKEAKLNDRQGKVAYVVVQAGKLTQQNGRYHVAMALLWKIKFDLGDASRFELTRSKLTTSHRYSLKLPDGFLILRPSGLVRPSIAGKGDYVTGKVDQRRVLLIQFEKK